MNLLPYQVKVSSKIQKKLLKKGVCLLNGEPRSGKTLSFIDAANTLYNHILIITTKKALNDVQGAVNSYKVSHKFDVINYHSCQKLHDNSYDCVILDESHKYITGYPKRSAIWQNVFHFTKKSIPIVFSSGTPTPEGYAGLYNMFALSYKTPWLKYKRFTAWHGKYGKPYNMRINNYNIIQYDRTHIKKVKKCIDPFTVTITCKEAGHKFEAEDKLHHIKLSKKQNKIIKYLDRDLLYENEKFLILGDTPSKLMQKKHQISGGFVKCEDDKLMTFKKNPKIDYINKTFDTDKTIILAFFKAEQDFLKTIYPHVGSVISDAEGVDYSHFENMVIYSMSYAASVYVQVRSRQLNIVKRKTHVLVHFLLSDIDQRIYDAVSKKKKFTARWYK